MVEHECLPEELAGRRWYEPSPHGREPDIAKHMERLEAFRRARKGKPGEGERRP